MKEELFYFSISSFIFAVAFGTIFPNLNLGILFFIFIILISIFLFFQNKNILKNKKRKIFFSLSIFFIFGLLYTNIFISQKKSTWDNFLNQEISHRFIVIDEPEFKGYKTKLILKFPENNNRVILWAPILPKYEYGDELLIDGWLLKIKNFDEKFDYINFLKKDNIFYELKYKNIKLLSKHKGFWLKEKLFLLKKEILNSIKKSMPEPESSLLAGLLIGAKEDMSKDLLEDFRKTGIIHIVVLSGYNLSLLAEFLMIILAFFGRKFSTIIGSISIALFAIMTGASATVLRAAIMALLIILAKRLGRNTEALKLLFLAAFLMLLWNPMLLIYDPSFQLSFLATLGLLLLAPKIESFIKYGNWKFFNLREILAATLSAQIFVFPLILYMMDSFSVVAPVVNLLVLVSVQFSMFLGIISLVSFYIFPVFSEIISFINYLILNYDITIVRYFANFKFSILEFKNFSLFLMFLIYFLYFLIWIYFYFRQRK